MLAGLELAILSKVRINGFGSNADAPGPERRLAGTALSARLSTKSRTMKSLLEKSSRVKLGPLGNSALEPDPFLSIGLGSGTAAGVATGYMDEQQESSRGASARPP